MWCCGHGVGGFVVCVVIGYACWAMIVVCLADTEASHWGKLSDTRACVVNAELWGWRTSEWYRWWLGGCYVRSLAWV